MQQKFLTLAVVFAFILTACGQAKDLEKPIFNPETENSETVAEALDEIGEELPPEEDGRLLEAEAFNWISAEEVAKHKTASDCWTIIHGQVFDITKAIGSHPGGEAILAGCGTDATEMFDSKPVTGTTHSEMARQNLDNFYLGDIAR